MKRDISSFLDTKLINDSEWEEYQKLKEENEQLQQRISRLEENHKKAIECIKKDRQKSYGSLEKKAFYCNKTDKLLEILEGDKNE